MVRRIRSLLIAACSAALAIGLVSFTASGLLAFQEPKTEKMAGDAMTKAEVMKMMTMMKDPQMMTMMKSDLATCLTKEVMIRELMTDPEVRRLAQEMMRDPNLMPTLAMTKDQQKMMMMKGDMMKKAMMKGDMMKDAMMKDMTMMSMMIKEAAVRLIVNGQAMMEREKSQ